MYEGEERISLGIDDSKEKVQRKKKCKHHRNFVLNRVQPGGKRRGTQSENIIY